MRFQNVYIKNCGGGINIEGPLKGSMENVSVIGCKGDGIRMDSRADFHLSNVSSTGNGGWGLNVFDAALTERLTALEAESREQISRVISGHPPEKAVQGLRALKSVGDIVEKALSTGASAATIVEFVAKHLASLS